MAASPTKNTVPSLFPCIEHPLRAIFSSPSHDSFLTVTEKGVISAVRSRSRADEFVIIPQHEKRVLLKSIRHGIFLTCDTKNGSIKPTKSASNVELVSSEVEKEKIQFTQWNLSFHDGGYTTLSTSGTNDPDVKCKDAIERDNDKQDEKSANCMSTVEAGHEEVAQFCLMRGEDYSVRCQPIVNGEKHDENAIWKVEFQTGELLFISSASQDQRIRCDFTGSLSPSNNWKGWEVWRFAETADGDGSVLISSFCHDKYFLCSDQSGTVFTNTDRTSVRCKWIIEKAPPSLSSSCLDGQPVGVVIRSVLTGRTLMLNNNSLCTVKAKDEDIELWQLETAHRQAYYMQLTPSTEEKGESWRIGINASAPYTTKSPLKRANEEWILEIQTDLMSTEPKGSGMIVTLQSEGKKTYLASRSDGTVYPAPGPTVNSLWRMDDVTVFGCTLTSVEHGRVLTRTLRTVPVVSKEERDSGLVFHELAYFQPEPRLPRRVDAPKMRKIALITTFAVATTVAVPFAIGGAVAALGIAEASVAAELVAAGLTAAEAAASVAAVGFTARTLMHGTKIGALEGDGSGKNDSCEKDEGGTERRPLCLWREW